MELCVYRENLSDIYRRKFKVSRMGVGLHDVCCCATLLALHHVHSRTWVWSVRIAATHAARATGTTYSIVVPPSYRHGSTVVVRVGSSSWGDVCVPWCGGILMWRAPWWWAFGDCAAHVVVGKCCRIASPYPHLSSTSADSGRTSIVDAGHQRLPACLTATIGCCQAGRQLLVASDCCS